MLPPTIRVVFADNHAIARYGIERALGDESRIEIVGSAVHFGELFELISTTHPHVVLLDVMGMCGSPSATVQHLRRDNPRMGIVMFSSSVDTAPELLRAGANGYVAKDDATGDLAEAIYAAAMGSTYLSPRVQEYMDALSVEVDRLHLTPREHEILVFVIQGHKTSAVADMVNIDPRSVDNCVARIRRKTGCETRTDLANWYRRAFGEPTPITST